MKKPYILVIRETESPEELYAIFRRCKQKNSRKIFFKWGNKEWYGGLNNTESYYRAFDFYKVIEGDSIEDLLAELCIMKL